MDAKLVSVRDLGGQLVGALDRGEQRLFILRRQLIASAGLNQHPQKQVEKVQILVRRLQRKWIDGEAGILQSDIQIRSAESPRQRFVAAAKIEDEGQRVILLHRLKRERQREDSCPSP